MKRLTSAKDLRPCNLLLGRAERTFLLKLAGTQALASGRPVSLSEVARQIIREAAAEHPGEAA